MTNSTTTALLTDDLIAELESSLSSWKGKPNVLLPSEGQFYRLGLVLSQLVDQQQQPQEEAYLGQVYRTLVEQVPPSHLRSVLEDLHEAFGTILEAFANDDNDDNNSTNDTQDIDLALQSMHGLYTTNSKPLLAAAAGHPVAGWSIQKVQLLHSVYEKLSRIATAANANDTNIKQIQEHLLSLVAEWLSDPNLGFEQLLPAIHELQDKADKYSKSAWEALIQLQSFRNPQWKEQMVQRFAETEQHDYIVTMFTLEEEDENDMAAPQQSSSMPSTTTTATSRQQQQQQSSSPQDTIQRLVHQVKSVFPHLGDGYIETALSHYQGDVERTTGALLEGMENPASLPVTLQRLDPQLPGRWKGLTSSQTQREDEEARRITQEAVRAMERQQEDEARALEVLRVTSVPTHNEYDDDYDDQYDDIDGFMSNDHGLYDDFETVRTYNKMMKQVEEEQAFWAENRNENRSTKKNPSKKKQSNNDDQDDETTTEGGGGRKYRGPDKIKGGRIPKPHQQPSKADKNSDNNNGDESNNQGKGRGGGGGRGGRGGRGRGGRGANKAGRGGRGGSDGGKGNSNGTDSTPNTSNPPGRGNARHKQNKLASRKGKQKQAMAKRAG